MPWGQHGQEDTHRGETAGPPSSQDILVPEKLLLLFRSLPSPGDLPDPGTEPRSPTLQAGFLPSEPPGKSPFLFLKLLYYFTVLQTLIHQGEENNI